MNKSELKSFATYARRELLAKVALRAKGFGMDEKNNIVIVINADSLIINGTLYPPVLRGAFESLKRQYELKGYNQLIEEVAYIWFNRIIALRYMEVHEYLPERVNVLSSSTGKVEPDILLQYKNMELEVDKPFIQKILDEGDVEAAYRKLLIAQCNALQPFLPFLFEKIQDFTEFLLPDYLLDSESIINKLVSNEALTESFAEVEVIGWLYQYYISEKKDQVFENLRKNIKISKENIPAATQLFTPRWIVRYMVDNSLGSLWLESYPESTLKNQLSYLVGPAEQSEDVLKQLEKLKNPNLSPEDIRLLDPACGSGHILIYIFEVLYSIYEERGYVSNDIPKLILEKNLFGIDIDDRAVQLTSFALMMKAREKSRRIFRNPPEINVIAIQESNDLPVDDMVRLIAGNGDEQNELITLFNVFIDAKNYGSILEPRKFEYHKYCKKIKELRHSDPYSLFDIPALNELHRVEVLIKQAKLLTEKYDVVITNPPYMGTKGMNDKLSKFVKKNYPEVKADMFAVFMERCNRYTKENGFHSEINQNSWMFLSSYETLRNKILKTNTLISMVHLGPHAFEEIGGQVVQSTTYVQRNTYIPGYDSSFFRLTEYTNAQDKEKQFLLQNNRFVIDQNNFNDIPGTPIAYWTSENVRSIFKETPKLSDIAEPRAGMQTSDNDRFLRLWFEPEIEKLNFESGSISEALNSKKKWFPYNKGGSSRKWYGNQDYVVAFDEENYELLSHTGNNLPSRQYYFLEGVTWSEIGSSSFSARFTPRGFIFGNKGPTIFAKQSDLYLILALLNSSVTNYLIKIISSTLSITAGNVAALPYIKPSNSDEILKIVNENIHLSKQDWDISEISWNFKKHPYLLWSDNENVLPTIWESWLQTTQSDFKTVQFNEKYLNEIFTEMYGLTEELISEIQKIDIIIADRTRETKSFLSYFIGCVLGRYSLDVDGLAYAGGNWDSTRYKRFIPNKSGIVLFTDDAYFEGDIISRLQEFLAVAYTPETVAENLQWIAESLEQKRNETAEERIRRYFLDEFFKDHCQVYQKRPIYWLVDSGRNGALRTLIYLHRYQSDTMATIRFEHLQAIQAKYLNEITTIDMRLANPLITATEKRAVEKKKEDYQKSIEELTDFDKELAEYANAQIQIDLDDGVKANYERFKGVLAKIK